MSLHLPLLLDHRCSCCPDLPHLHCSRGDLVEVFEARVLRNRFSHGKTNPVSVGPPRYSKRSRGRASRAQKANPEDASDSWDVLHAQDTAGGNNALLRDGKAKSQATPVVTGLRERLEHSLNRSRGKPAAIVVDVDRDALEVRVHAQCDRGVRVGEFESVLKQVQQGRQQQVAVAGNYEGLVDLGNHEHAAAGTRVE